MARVLKRIQVNGQVIDVDVTADASMTRPAGYGEGGTNDWAVDGEPKQIIPAAHIVDVDTNAAIDADATVAAISALSASSGADTIDRAALNISLGTLVTEINALITAYNALAGKYNGLAGKYNSLATKLNTLFAQNETHGFNATS